MAAALSSNSYLDCRSANQQAIDSINDGVRNGYVPECDSYGGYKPVQCYKVRYTYILSLFCVKPSHKVVNPPS